MKSDLVETVDVFCPAGPAEDPRPVHRGKHREVSVAPEVFRRIVIAIDYSILEQIDTVDVIERLERMVRDSTAVREELMIVAFTTRVHVEQPFTTDREEVLRTLARMKQDPSLWQERPKGRLAQSEHLTEFKLFRGLAGLVRWLGTYDGRKAIVFVSDLESKIPDKSFGGRPLMSTALAFDYDHRSLAFPDPG